MVPQIGEHDPQRPDLIEACIRGIVGQNISRPLISIGMPVYNEAANLPQALESLLAQSYDHLEIVISDNASTDGTDAIARRYAEHDPRITVVRNGTNLGVVENFNQVFRMSHGEYFMWAAADDRWDASFVARCLEVLQADRSIVLAYPQTVLIDDDGTAYGVMPGRLDTRHHDHVSRFMLTVWGCINGNPIYGLIRSSGLRDTHLLRNHTSADKVLLAELALAGEFAYIPQPLFCRGWIRHGERKDEARYQRWMRKTGPERTIRLAFHRIQLLQAYLSLAWHAGLPLSRRIALCSTLVSGLAAIHGWGLFRPVAPPRSDK